MVTILLVMFGLGVLVLALFTGFGIKRIAKSAYASGRRDGLREAVRCCRERAHLAGTFNPQGELRWGQIRAQTAHQLELDIQALVEKKS